MNSATQPIMIPCGKNESAPQYKTNIFDPSKASPPNSWNARLHSRLHELYGVSPVLSQFTNH